MANLFNPSFVFLLSLFLAHQATATSHHHHDLKSLHFSLYQQETINKTGYIVVNGVAGPPVGQTTTPFGTVFVFRDHLTLRANASSKVVGISEGTSITSALDGLQSISVAKITLKMKGMVGSLSILGSVHNTRASKLPVVGGTEDFMFVQGYIVSSPVDLQGIDVTYKVEFHLYWPPYASFAKF
ncbi:dirigent protein 7 [Amborella trichopoda]|uniref:Dirigent protein n=1 Tax=Amborella trichopoda TaxID=13333 RepID=W1NLL2_AMBTC|nr:dirigent protein 7 [Amborella trichopoda]ERM96125.1 hypothetical protein AMTR_s00001p00015790 [Amborella trichopoda]|eukprot:XP_006828709.1 dirigent protein 7 [Amborella trichopoda]